MKTVNEWGVELQKRRNELELTQDEMFDFIFPDKVTTKAAKINKMSNLETGKVKNVEDYLAYENALETLEPAIEETERVGAAISVDDLIELQSSLKKTLSILNIIVEQNVPKIVQVNENRIAPFVSIMPMVIEKMPSDALKDIVSTFKVVDVKNGEIFFYTHHDLTAFHKFNGKLKVEAAISSIFGNNYTISFISGNVTFEYI